MAKVKTFYLCKECGAHSPAMMGRCSECSAWGSLEEVKEGTKASAPVASSLSWGQLDTWMGEEEKPSSFKLGKPPTSNNESSLFSQLSQPLQEGASQPRLAQAITAIQAESHVRFSTGLGELDRVLGGGLLPGAYILVGGDPGIGKSTLMLQTAAALARSGKRVLYVTGEEAPLQVRLRAERLNALAENLWLYAETDMRKVLEEVRAVKPHVLIVDSVQAVYCQDVNSSPGSVGQIRAVANLLMGVSKAWNMSVILVGHVTKDGQLSGPKLLEHMVDCVLYFEGEKYKDLRLLRTVKNRFGSTLELGVFEMKEEGLQEIDNPSQLFLGQQGGETPMPGCATVCTIEGTRPILVEIQALVGTSSYASGRRVVTGMETGRLHQVVAVLERRLGLDFSHQDIYVNVVGGLRIEEPAADLGMALALVSSLRNISMLPYTMVIGEIGLTGELRAVRHWRQRLTEAAKIGYKRVLLPGKAEEKARYKQELGEANTLEVFTVNTLMDALAVVFQPEREGSGNNKIASI